MPPRSFTFTYIHNTPPDTLGVYFPWTCLDIRGRLATLSYTFDQKRCVVRLREESSCYNVVKPLFVVYQEGPMTKVYYTFLKLLMK